MSNTTDIHTITTGPITRTLTIMGLVEAENSFAEE